MKPARRCARSALGRSVITARFKGIRLSPESVPNQWMIRAAGESCRRLFRTQSARTISDLGIEMDAFDEGL